MNINTKAQSVPYVFTTEEIESIQQTFNNPLITAFLQATKSNIMIDRFEIKLTEGTQDEVTARILVQEAFTHGQLELLDNLSRIATCLKA